MIVHVIVLCECCVSSKATGKPLAMLFKRLLVLLSTFRLHNIPGRAVLPGLSILENIHVMFVTFYHMSDNFMY